MCRGGERGWWGRELRARPLLSPAGSVALGPGFAARAVAVHDLGARPGLAAPAAPRALAPVSRPPSRAGLERNQQILRPPSVFAVRRPRLRVDH